MRIAFIAPFGLQPKGTVSARMMPLAQALAERGHQVRVVIPPWNDPSAPRSGQVRFIPSTSGSGSVQVVTLSLSNRLPDSLALTSGLVKQALRPIPQSKIDVVHVFKPIGYSGLAGLALQALRVPWVLDVDDWEGPGGWVDVNPYSIPQKWAATLLEAMLPRMAGAVTAASRTLEARAWSFGLPRRRVFYLPNGVSQDKYGSWAGVEAQSRVSLRVRYNLEDSPVILLYTRFVEFPYWWPLDVLKRVIGDHPTVKLLAVGSGFFGEEDKLISEAARMGIADHVIATGRVAEAALPAHLALGGVALYPMSDNLINRAKSPVKVLEPMVMGLPIVAHRVGQAAEFVGDAGVLVQPGDLQGMAEEVSALLGDADRRRRLGEMARWRVWEEFNWEGLSGVAEEAYKTLLVD